MASAPTAVQPTSDPGEHPAQRLLLRFKGALTATRSIISASTVVTLNSEGVSKSLLGPRSRKGDVSRRVVRHGCIVSAEFGRLTGAKCPILLTPSAPVHPTHGLRIREALVGVTLIPKSPSLRPCHVRRFLDQSGDSLTPCRRAGSPARPICGPQNIFTRLDVGPCDFVRANPKGVWHFYRDSWAAERFPSPAIVRTRSDGRTHNATGEEMVARGELVPSCGLRESICCLVQIAKNGPVVGSDVLHLEPARFDGREIFEQWGLAANVTDGASPVLE